MTRPSGRNLPLRRILSVQIDREGRQVILMSHGKVLAVVSPADAPQMSLLADDFRYAADQLELWLPFGQ